MSGGRGPAQPSGSVSSVLNQKGTGPGPRRPGMPMATTFGAFTNQSGPKIMDARPVVRQRVAPPSPRGNASTPPVVSPKSVVEPVPEPELELEPVASAPYPGMPSAVEVEILKEEVDAELLREKRRLTGYLRAKKSDLLVVSPLSNGESAGIHDFFGFTVPHSAVASVCDQNRVKTARAKDQARICSGRQRFTSMSHLSYVEENVRSARGLLVDPMLRNVFDWRDLEHEKARHLTREYVDMYEIFHGRMCTALNELQCQNRQLVDDWPEEMVKLGVKTGDRDILMKYVSVDQPMYLDDLEFDSYAYYDVNGLVENPVKAHNEFKNRLVWTTAERQTFLDKYRLHPREFRKIAASLPQKSVKDVIEYYYRYGRGLKLRELERQNKKKGRKIVSERLVRK